MDDATTAAILRDRLLPGSDVPAHLVDRLAAAAAEAHLDDLVHRTVDSPLGSLLLAATPDGLVRVAFEGEGHDDVLADLAVRISPRVVPAGSQLDDLARQVDDWFAGRRHDFAVRLDWQLSAGFRRDVLRRLREIEWGETASYGDLAARVDNPGAARAVGSACATNPIPLVVPCHRVVRADGSTGEYRGGRDAKRWLLDHESEQPTLLG